MKFFRTSRIGCRVSSRRGFTLVELLVSLAIFAIMTALLVAKYGNFNQSVLLTDLAYDVALTVRTAQTYGTSVKAIENGSATGAFENAYGVHFSTDATNGANKTVIMYSKSVSSGSFSYSALDQTVSTYAVKRNAYVAGFCVGKATLVNGVVTYTWSSCDDMSSSHTLDITYVRPEPDANICFDGTCLPTYTVARVDLKASDGSVRSVIALANGQITVAD